MSSCLVCAATAAVYCEQDNAYLCKKCDQTIHGHNVLAQRHVRRPLCDLCHRSVAAVWCKEDAAYLCSGCDVEVHAANPIPHDRVAVTPIGASCAVSPRLPRAAIFGRGSPLSVLPSVCFACAGGAEGCGILRLTCLP